MQIRESSEPIIGGCERRTVLNREGRKNRIHRLAALDLCAPHLFKQNRRVPPSKVYHQHQRVCSNSEITATAFVEIRINGHAVTHGRPTVSFPASTFSNQARARTFGADRLS